MMGNRWHARVVTGTSLTVEVMGMRMIIGAFFIVCSG